MDTHEHLIPDDDLPGAGVLDSDFARNMVREQEEQGIILWNEDAERYEPSARMLIGAVGANLLAKAQDIDPRLTQDEVMREIINCCPWVGDCHFTEIPADEFPGTVESGDLADTFPEDWLPDAS